MKRDWRTSIPSWILLGLMLSACGGSPTNEHVDALDSTDSNETSVTVDSDTDPGDQADWPEGKYISIEETYQRLCSEDPDLQFLNVSDEEFWNLGHIEGSLVIPWDTLAGRLGEVDPQIHTIVYCRRGVRSEVAYETLIDNAYELVWVMGDGGLEAWIELGYPTVPCEHDSIQCE